MLPGIVTDPAVVIESLQHVLPELVVTLILKTPVESCISLATPMSADPDEFITLKHIFGSPPKNPGIPPILLKYSLVFERDISKLLLSHAQKRVAAQNTSAPTQFTVTSAFVGKLICGVAPAVAANGLAAVTEVTVPVLVV